MSFTATINSIEPTPDGTGSGVTMLVSVTFADSVSGFTYTRNYNFPTSETVSAGKSVIQGDGEVMKSQLSQIGALQSAVGSVITL